MTRTLSLGYSPCPNDTFIFGALAEGRIDPSPLAFKIFMADVEVLNRKAGAGELDVTKVSVSAVVRLLGEGGGGLGHAGSVLVAPARSHSSRWRTANQAIRAFTRGL